MKRLLSCLLILSMLMLPVPSLAGGFSDIAGHWAEQEILDLAEKGIIKGISADKFAPDEKMTRAQFVAIMNRAFPELFAEYQYAFNNAFTDVKESDWYCVDLISAADLELVKGTGSGVFGVNLPISRQDACVLLLRYAGDKLPNIETGSSSLADHAAIAEYARKAASVMIANGIIKGYPDGTFKPAGNITRGEVAAIVKRSLSKITGANLSTDPEPEPEPKLEAEEKSSGGGGGGKTNPDPVRPSNYQITLDDIYDRLDGSTVTIPLSQAISAELFSDFSGLAIDVVTHNQTDAAIKNVVDGQKDLALVTYPSQANLDYAKQQGINLAIVPVVNDAFVFMVNEKNSLNDLSSSQIRQIYSGQTTDWQALGGIIAGWADYVDEWTKEWHFNEYGQLIDKLLPPPILPFQRNATSGSQSGMVAFMGDTLISVPFYDALVIGGMGPLIDRVNQIPNSLGYSYLYYANTMYMSEAKLISVDGIAPTNANIMSGKYPIITPYYAVYRADAALDSFPRAMTELLLSKKGQEIAAEVGYTPLGTIPALPKPGSYLMNVTKEFSIENIYMKIKQNAADFSLPRAAVSELYNDLVGRSSLESGTVTDLIDGKIDLVIDDYPTAADLAYAVTKGVDLDIISIAGDAYGFIVNKSNPINGLTIEQVTKIFSGEISDWGELGRAAGSIRVYNNALNTIAARVSAFYNQLFDFEQPFFPRWGYGSGFDSGYVDGMLGDSDAITYSVLSLEDAENYKFLRIDGFAPGDEDYPWNFGYYAVNRKEEKQDSFSRKFVDYLLSEDIQEIARQLGYIPN
ncbi:MAG: S-layer homology domain-containing protein [Clostridiales bacterium]|nr:S-layer homology domain-containing protein [Clostridiales bacterium]